MRGPGPFLFLLLSAVSLGLVAWAPGAAAVAQSKRLQPGQVWEVNVELVAGQRAPWNITLDTATPEVYDLHSHAPGDLSNVTYYDRGLFNRTVAGTFVAPADNTYSWTVAHQIGNDAFTATIDVSPQGPAPAKTPFPGFAWAAMTIAAAVVARSRGRA